jgi:hypothetical protein
MSPVDPLYGHGSPQGSLERHELAGQDHDRIEMPVGK